LVSKFIWARRRPSLKALKGFKFGAQNQKVAPKSLKKFACGAQGGNFRYAQVIWALLSDFGRQIGLEFIEIVGHYAIHQLYLVR